MADSQLITDLKTLARGGGSRIASLQAVADCLKERGEYRWVGLYDVDHSAGVVTNVVWSGPAAPAHPVFAITDGLTSEAVSTARTVNVGDVLLDNRYLVALGTTRSEIIIPILDPATAKVVGTVDVESENLHTFDPNVQAFLELCADAIRPLWQRAV